MTHMADLVAATGYRFRTEPEPVIFLVTVGSPTYSIEPEPDTFTASVSLAATTTLPLPEMLIVADLHFRPSVLDFPEPEMLRSRESTSPAAARLPEPLNSTFNCLPFRFFRSMSPLPDRSMASRDLTFTL